MEDRLELPKVDRCAIVIGEPNDPVARIHTPTAGHDKNAPDRGFPYILAGCGLGVDGRILGSENPSSASDFPSKWVIQRSQQINQQA